MSLFIHNISSKNDHETTDGEIFRNIQTGPFPEVLFLYVFCIELLFIFSFITCHSRFFAVYRIKKILQFCNVQCCSFSITCAILLKLTLLRLFSVVCVWLYILTEKVSLSKKWKSSSLFQNGQTCRLFEPEFFFFFNKKSCKLL